MVWVLCAVTHTRGSCSYIRAVLVQENKVLALSLNQDGAAGDELRRCFPSLDTPGTFCSAPIPHLPHHIPLPVLLLFLCSAVLGHQAAATSEPALGGSLGSGEATGKVFSGLRCVMDGGGFGDASSSTAQCGHSQIPVCQNFHKPENIRDCVPGPAGTGLTGKINID